MTLPSIDPAPPATRVRFAIVAAAMLMSVLLYLDRFCISFAGPLIKEDLSLSQEQMSWILGAFFLSYGLGQVPTGWLSDRYGPRRMLTLYILGWSLFTALTGLAVGFLLLILLRLGFGLAQAGAYPTAGTLLRAWVPFAERGRASGWVASGGRIGGAIAPTLTAYLIVLFVPVDRPSRFTESDLLDFGHLSYLLAQPQADAKTESLSQVVADGLPSKTREVVLLRGTQYARAVAWQEANGGSLSEHVSRFLSPPVAPEERTRVVLALNELLASQNLYDGAVFAEIALSDEARRLARLERQASKAELERLNRLLLEAAYPQDLRKLYVRGWRPVLVVYGLLGLVVAGLFWFHFRDRPKQHPWCNAAEADLIAGSAAAAASQPRAVGGAPIGKFLKSRTMWLTSISQAGTNLGWVFLVTWLPRYLDEVHQVPIEMRGWMAGIPLWIGWIGMLCGGVLTDRSVRRFGLRWGRALPMGLTRFAAMGAFLMCLLPVDRWFGPAAAPWVLTGAFALVAFSVDLGVPATWAFCQDVGGRHVGSVLGWGNMWGNLAAFISPWLLNRLFEVNQDWNLSFLACAVSFFISGLAGLGVDATRPIDLDEAVAA